MTVAEWAQRALEPSGTGRPARVFLFAHGVVLGLGIAAAIAGTMPDLDARLGLLIGGVSDLALLFFTIEFLVRLRFAPDHDPAGHHLTPIEARLRWLRSPWGIIDGLGAIPYFVALAAGVDPVHAHLLGMLWALKLGRHAPRLGLIGRVLSEARGPLMSVFCAFLIVLLGAATLAYLVEGPHQPDAFGTLPRALWWAVTTLTTTGYGDVVPVTPLGRVLGGTVMVCGILVFALWAGILATEFSLEMRRHEFLRTWDLVAKVPYFDKIGAGSIAEVARLLKPRRVPAGTVVMRRGEPGDRMYFIVEGEIEIQIKPKPVHIGQGGFFGEIALLTGGPRTATAVATRRCTLLALDIADFRELCARRPEIMKAIDEEAARRVEQHRAMAKPG